MGVYHSATEVPEFKKENLCKQGESGEEIVNL